MSELANSKPNRTLYMLSSVRRFRRKKAFAIGRRTIPVPMLCMITRGHGELVINDIVHPIEPFQLYYLTPGMTVHASGSAQGIEYYVLLMDAIHAVKHKGRWMPGTAGSAPLLPSGRVHLRDAREVLLKVDELYRSATARRSDASSTLLDLQLQALLECVLQHIPKPEQQPYTDSSINSSLTYMHQNYHKKISRETLANIAKLTPNAFCRSFKRVTGLAPTDYLNRIRIEHAKEQLSPSSSVKEVAASIGYGSEYYFSRIFKDMVGIPPSLFIKRERLSVATASRTGFQDNLVSIGMEVAAAVDCYRYSDLDEEEYNRQLISQLEQLRLVKPDLIIADYFHQSLYETLKQIAPTVILEHHLDWSIIHMRLAELVGREKEAIETYRQLEERAAEIKIRLQEGAASGVPSVTVMQVTQRNIRIQGAVNHPLNELLYSHLGLKPGSAVPPHKMREEWLLEELPSMESDHVFIIRRSEEPDLAQLLTKLERTQRDTYSIPNWFQLSWTPLGRNRIMDEIIRILEDTRQGRAALFSNAK
ncbi:MAG: btr 3 [Paenibacillus sp.]|nr:btr 3 [Paenibacillus sp.]